ncbi:mitogen-activated protein kinase kinase 1 [Artemisia annua]|uniref:mitogen-activated protein kinase kinase n=1 Tax=Artemisia annua TaxID=35608 RepID=A0A2U1N157_ARTAN|nr:mitogen-activated protein kinase kinase 1 [Artemisia annua]
MGCITTSSFTFEGNSFYDDHLKIYFEKREEEWGTMPQSSTDDWEKNMDIVFFAEYNSKLFESPNYITRGQAIKVIQMNVEESAHKQIAQELKINQSSQSTNATMCYQSFYDNDVVSIILEYMDGRSLADFLKTICSIPEHYVAAVCKQKKRRHHKSTVIDYDAQPSDVDRPSHNVGDTLLHHNHCIQSSVANL